MAKDRLFLLKPDFRDGDKGPFYCPDGLCVEGLLSYYPQLRKQIEVTYLDFPRPRAVLVGERGAEHQGCPVLILGGDAAAARAAGLGIQHAKGKAFLAQPAGISAYLSAAYGIGTPH